MAKTVRWVQYEAAVFVRIEVDEDGWDTEITKVVTANDVEELHLARDDRGHFRVYDENFEPASESEILDGDPGGGVDRRGPPPLARQDLPGVGRRDRPAPRPAPGTPMTTRTRTRTPGTTMRAGVVEPSLIAIRPSDPAFRSVSQRAR